jgi:hypothetical protein
MGVAVAHGWAFFGAACAPFGTNASKASAIGLAASASDRREKRSIDTFLHGIA